MERIYTISDLASEFDVTPRTLRFYEDKGLLTPQRRGTTRLYSERDRTRLKLTLRGKRLGFTLEECAEIIDLYGTSGNAGDQQLKLLLARIREHRATLLTRLQDIQETLSAMNEVERSCLDMLTGQGAGRASPGAARAVAESS
ncbi:MAG: MerR family DNA-binding transcriptional regulator [Gammaproteobacteria bacterium]|nr:MerR family DNA-binding transcriptional regulator [Gammaproteobacteria bacterium]